MNTKELISKFNKSNILVIGDIILDQYIKGDVSRISPEAPVPVVVQEESFYKPGGAANVANNLRSLGAGVTLVGKIGRDLEGRTILRELKKNTIDTDGVFVDSALPTILKTRVIAQHQQIVRIDREKTKPSSDGRTTGKIFSFIERNLDRFDAVILSDYGKGMITAQLVNLICGLSIAKKKIVTVDPKVEHFNFYRRVTAITPNLKEAENAIRNIKITSQSPHALGIHHDHLGTDGEINLAGQELLKFLGLESLLITLGERGMRLFQQGKKSIPIAAKAKEVFDVTGAGDTVIAIFTLALTVGATKEQAAHLANAAAGIVVGKMGAATVTQQELVAAFKKELARSK